MPDQEYYNLAFVGLAAAVAQAAARQLLWEYLAVAPQGRPAQGSSRQAVAALLPTAVALGVAGVGLGHIAGFDRAVATTAGIAAFVIAIFEAARTSRAATGSLVPIGLGMVWAAAASLCVLAVALSQHPGWEIAYLWVVPAAVGTVVLIGMDHGVRWSSARVNRLSIASLLETLVTRGLGESNFLFVALLTATTAAASFRASRVAATLVIAVAGAAAHQSLRDRLHGANGARPSMGMVALLGAAATGLCCAVAAAVSATHAAFPTDVFVLLPTAIWGGIGAVMPFVRVHSRLRGGGARTGRIRMVAAVVGSIAIGTGAVLGGVAGAAWGAVLHAVMETLLTSRGGDAARGAVLVRATHA